MKRLWFAIPLLGVVGMVMRVWYTHDSRPAYVGNAESRLSSYLGVTHGPVKCSAIPVNDGQDRWKMECLSKEGESFEYDLYPPEKAPYTVADGFYLVAQNKSAIATASEGLTEYLRIDTTKPR